MFAKLAGLGLAATGVAHFIAPGAFEAITKPAFPNNTDEAIMRNGATETVLGLAIALPATRKLGVFGLGAYGAWLGYNAATAASS